MTHAPSSAMLLITSKLPTVDEIRYEGTLLLPPPVAADRHLVLNAFTRWYEAKCEAANRSYSIDASTQLDAEGNLVFRLVDEDDRSEAIYLAVVATATLN